MPWKITTYLLANSYFSVFECYWISSLDNNPVNPLTKELFNKIPEGVTGRFGVGYKKLPPPISHCNSHLSRVPQVDLVVRGVPEGIG